MTLLSCFSEFEQAITQAYKWHGLCIAAVSGSRRCGCVSRERGVGAGCRCFEANMDIQLGPELFRFETFKEWVDKGRSWYATCGVREHDWVTVDSAGRICRYGAQFMRTRDQGTFPIVVYARDTDVVPKEAIRLDGMRRELEARGIS